MATQSEIKSFFAQYAPAVVNSCYYNTLFPSVVLAQAALETGYGKTVRKAANNMFGIKPGSGWSGKVISLNTQEVIGGVRKTFAGTGKTYPSYSAAMADGADPQTVFRAYDSISDSITDHSRLIVESERYKAVREGKTPDEQCEALQACGYATGTNYANSLKIIIQANNLTKYDTKKKIMKTLEIILSVVAIVLAGLTLYKNIA